MGYEVSYNKPSKKCKIHKSNCSSLRQIKGEEPSVNQKYSGVLSSCETVLEYISNKNYQNYSCCKHCKPNCCNDLNER